MDYTRVTVHGSTHRGDLVVPSAEPLVTVLPRLLEMLSETSPGGAGVALTTSEGIQLDTERSLAEQQVRDGQLLLVVPADQTPPPPQVSDLVGAVTDRRSSSRGRWTLDTARRCVVLLEAPLAGLACWQAGSALPAATVTVAVVLVLLAIAACRAWRTWPATAVVSAAVGAAATVGAGAVAGSELSAAHPVLVPVASGLACAWLVVALAPGLAGGQRPMLATGAVGTVGCAALPALLAMGMGVTGAGAVIATAAAFGLGLVPAAALSLSGLTELEDAATAGRPPSRGTTQEAIDGSFRAMTGLTLALAVLAAGGLCLLAGSHPTQWGWGLACALGIVVVCRARFFPFAAQVVALGGVLAALVTVLLAATPLPGPLRGLVIAAVAAALALVLVKPVPEHTAARVRTWANLVELIAVIATVPLLLGHFGVFSDLLEVFSR
ncbi:type VII secretion integral membrane protein EccD [Propionibacterium australiense]|uniref:Type VII secretion integral membrane protein EccD n=1 Tax=Propionibacterium australiense TaxID=119981 RepID=A0A8B3FT81_9ACTN|nr:type VII secretion integral membrane protein EccD [Propionibacterium australiense]RLP11391.1 type VII secretion integral membrane protein EccD [Propionibacterium australiense]